MDRKSITGFLLIALVIILYPWYMSIVSPSIPNENNSDKIKLMLIKKIGGPIVEKEFSQQVVEKFLKKILINKNL